MHHPEYSSVDLDGKVSWKGPLSSEKGTHEGMPPRTDAYLPGQDRGHVNASSLGGANIPENIVPMHADVNRAGGGWYAMEKGERSALQHGASIESEKTAVMSSSTSGQPEVLLASDTITYPDGHTENSHLSFANEAYADQEAWNELSASLPGTFDAPNLGDGGRASMTTDEYGALMEATDQELPGIAADYAPADFSGLPGAEAVEAAPASADADGSVSADNGADIDPDVDD